ncbi:SRPBCC domain-containing protein [Micrococcaceae bacterium Sec5.7]
MAGNYVATSMITIDAPTSRVWSVLTDHDAIEEFMFGTDVVTDWAIGGPIVWRGVWEGKNYEDKGTVLEFEPGRRLVNTHFSPLSGQEDTPENYHTLTWTLEDDAGKTDLTLSQDNNATTEEAAHSKGMWDQLVEGVKSIAERESGTQPPDQTDSRPSAG